MSSGSVFLNNLDDFIVPSQACVNPFVLGTATHDSPAPSSASEQSGQVKVNSLSNRSKGKQKVTLGFSDDNDYKTSIIPQSEPNLIRQKASSTAPQKTVAAVSLTDCLACSGCVTSAESVLIQEQSSTKFLQILEEGNPEVTVVLMISPNSRASIAQFLGLSKEELFLKLAVVLKTHGVKYVIDAASGADIALVECREEFLSR
jgi:hypothetical protein